MLTLERSIQYFIVKKKKTISVICYSEIFENKNKNGLLLFPTPLWKELNWKKDKNKKKPNSEMPKTEP